MNKKKLLMWAIRNPRVRQFGMKSLRYKWVRKLVYDQIKRRFRGK